MGRKEKREKKWFLFCFLAVEMNRMGRYEKVLALERRSESQVDIQ